MEESVLSLSRQISQLETDFADSYLERKMNEGFGDLSEEIEYLIQYIHSQDIMHAELSSVATEAFKDLAYRLDELENELTYEKENSEELKNELLIIQEELNSATNTINFYKKASLDLERHIVDQNLASNNTESVSKIFKRSQSMKWAPEKEIEKYKRQSIDLENYWRIEYNKVLADNSTLSSKIESLKDRVYELECKVLQERDQEEKEKRKQVIIENFEIVESVEVSERVSESSESSEFKGRRAKTAMPFVVNEFSKSLLKSTFKDSISHESQSPSSLASKKRRFNTLLMSFKTEAHRLPYSSIQLSNQKEVLARQHVLFLFRNLFLVLLLAFLFTFKRIWRFSTWSFFFPFRKCVELGIRLTNGLDGIQY